MRVANTIVGPNGEEIPGRIQFVTHDRAENISPGNLPAQVVDAYQTLAATPKYKHFVRIPERIIQCIDYFEIECDRATARERLQAYYLFIGVVDDVIDSGQLDSGRSILDHLNTPVPLFDQNDGHSKVRLVTEMLKCHATDETYLLMVSILQELYREVLRERAAPSIDSYLERRRSVGSLTAEASYVLIGPLLNGEREQLCRFMKEVGAIGCLVDSLIDLSADRRLGLLSFEPGIMSYTKLIGCILRQGLRVSLNYPGLVGLFFQAIGDNIRDRFRAEQRSSQPSFVSDRKAEPASVA